MLTELKKAAEMLNMKKKEVAELIEEYNEYYNLQDTVRSAVLGEDFTPGWAKFLSEKVRKTDELKNFEVLANGLKLFIASNKKHMEELGNLIKLQSDLRFKKAIELANVLLKEAAEIYVA
ncbi:MAG: hypothetical protein QW666_02175 [Candidatus Woesearchaeota archaeon]